VSRVRSRSQGHGSTPFTRALYPPGGERLGDEPDNRPISLIHSFAKILSKLLAIRLGSKLNQLISISQKRCIHDNFVFVQQVIKDLHEKRIIKLDISKVFDTVNWSYMLSILQHLGFGQMWRNWISLLWCTTSSCYLLNG
jgi:hypothetical protein